MLDMRCWLDCNVFEAMDLDYFIVANVHGDAFIKWVIAEIFVKKFDEEKKIIRAYWYLCCLVEYSFLFRLHLVSVCPGRYWPLVIWRSFMLSALFYLFQY